MTTIGNDIGTIIVAEDDPNIADLVDMYLRREGYRVLIADTAEAALEHAARENPRLVIFDIGLKGRMDGLEACNKLRATSAVPVIMLTARDSEVDRVLGLELGADDYMTKPFSPRELVARVKAIFRRLEPSPDAAQQPLQVGLVHIDPARREARNGDQPVELTNQEFDLLVYLARHQGVALGRRQILDGAWEPGWYGDERTVDVHVRQLRKKFGEALPLDTVWGVGYRLS